MYFLSLQLIDNQEYVFVKLTFSSGLIIEVSHVVQVRAEGPKALSPGHRPGYNGNQQGAL